MVLWIGFVADTEDVDAFAGYRVVKGDVVHVFGWL